MNNSRFLWEKILLSMGLALLSGFVLFSCAIVWSVIHGVEQDAESHLYGVTTINEAKLNGVLSTGYKTVMDAVISFESLDKLPEKRRRPEGKRILTWMLDNSYLYNVWVAYEPDSFDGADAPHGDEYPGAPSGRYVRSYIRAKGHGGEELLSTVEDMDESELNDPAICDWYAIPLETGKAYNDFGHVSLYDYKTEEGALVSITISNPIMRDGKSVGVVGGDILVGDLALVDESNQHIVTAVFSAEGKLIFSNEVEQIGTMMQDMNFTSFQQIHAAMQEEREIFLKNEFSWFLGANAFTYLKPVQLEDFDGQTVFLYAALPSSVVERAIFVALRPIAISLCVLLLAFVALLFFIAYHVVTPLDRLMQTMDSISQTGTVQDFPYLKRRDEIGGLARSISRLLGYFRMRLNFLYLIKIKLESHLAIKHVIHESLNFEEVIKYILRRLRVYCNADTARFFIGLNGKMRLFAISGAAGEFHIQSIALAPELEGHERLLEALEGKHYLLLKAYAMRAMKLEFIAPQAWSVCVLPIRDEAHLRAFIILEIAGSERVILHDDMILTFIADRLTNFFARHAPALDMPNETIVLKNMLTKVNEMVSTAAQAKSSLDENVHEPALDDAPDNEKGREADTQTSFMDAARSIPDLEVDKALFMLGDNTPLYKEMLSISARELSISMDKMREFIAVDDTHAFAISVHGSKGALNAIGAFSLGEMAYQLEMSAKKNDLEGCRLSYPFFEQKLSAFVMALQTVLPKDVESPREMRNIEDLVADLKAVHVALEEYNLALANERLRHAIQFSHTMSDMDEALIAKKLESISSCLENIEYEEAEVIIQELLTTIDKDGSGAGAAE